MLDKKSLVMAKNRKVDLSKRDRKIEIEKFEKKNIEDPYSNVDFNKLQDILLRYKATEPYLKQVWESLKKNGNYVDRGQLIQLLNGLKSFSKAKFDAIKEENEEDTPRRHILKYRSHKCTHLKCFSFSPKVDRKSEEIAKFIRAKISQDLGQKPNSDGILRYESYKRPILIKNSDVYTPTKYPKYRVTTPTLKELKDTLRVN